MKFTDGNWLLQPGLQAHHPAEAYDVAREGDALVIHAPTRRIKHRGDTLQGPLLTIRLTSPLADVVRVQIEHFAGAANRGPVVPLEPLPPASVTIVTEGNEPMLRSGALSAQVARDGDWQLVFKAGDRVITSSGARGIGYIQWPGHGTFVHERLSLGVGECVYGLGERFTAFVKNGQVVENWNRDGGTCSEQAYKCVPFYLTNRGYGVLVNDSGPVSFEVASERVSQVQFSTQGERLEYFLIYGPTPKEILRKLTALTGRPALPPAWSFGLWLTTSFTTSYDEATVCSFIDGMKQRDLPLHVFHFDCFWMREFEWCNFQWDARTFSDPAGLLKRLRDRGLKICLWINPYIGQRSPLFAEGKREGYLLKRPNGDVWQSDLWQPGMGIVDFTKASSEARFHVVDLMNGTVESYRVAHGSGSDPSHSGFLSRFSNDFGSYATSSGAYTTGEYYHGKYGLSMKTHGLDWTNNNAEARAIVIHNAWYAEPEMIAAHGKLGRSQGCFAFSRDDQWSVMRKLAGGRMIYADKLV